MLTIKSVNHVNPLFITKQPAYSGIMLNTIPLNKGNIHVTPKRNILNQ